VCFGVPGQVVELAGGEDAPEGRTARVLVGGASRVVSLALLDGEAIEPGSWVLIHLGYALERLDAQDAEETLAALRLGDDGHDDGDDGGDDDEGPG
jgi:hydrogenase assembly chaperone HypC/HupF